MSAVAFYLADDLTAATALSVTPNPIISGDESDPLILHLWCAKGSPGSPASGPISLYEMVKNALNVWVSSGLPMLDQGWLMARVNGIDNDSDTSMTDYDSGWVRLGSGMTLSVPSISADCARYVTIKARAPQADGAPTETPNFKVRQLHDEASAPLMQAVSHEGDGVLMQLGDRRCTGWVETVPPDTFPGTRAWAELITPTGTPDAIVHVGWRCFMTRGREFWEEPTDLTLNQNDSAAVALTSGKEYRAIISQPWAGGPAVATKGLLANAGASTFPAVPALSSVIGWVLVSYDAAGSTIAAGDIHVTAVSGRFRPWADGTDLTLYVGAGIARSGGLTMWNLDTLSIEVTDAATTYVWRSAGGLTLTATEIPTVEGDLPIAKVTAAGGVITVVEDLRTFWIPNGTEIALVFDADEATGRWVSRPIAQHMALGRVYFTAQTASAGGATGSTVADIHRVRAGTSTTVFTNQGATIESRPEIAASGYKSVNAMPEVTQLEPGDWLEVQGDTITSGGTQASILGIVAIVAPLR